MSDDISEALEGYDQIFRRIIAKYTEGTLVFLINKSSPLDEEVAREKILEKLRDISSDFEV